MLDQEQGTRSGGALKAVIIGAIAVAVIVAVSFVVIPMLRPAAKPVPAPVAKAEPAPRLAPAPVAPAAEPEAPRPSRPRPRREAPAEPPPPPPGAPAGPTLVVESDVPGASVFVNRQYLGTTPLSTTTIAPGRHQLNASADGEDGIVQTIEVGERGETTITLRFKEVRLDAAIGVVHKHGIGGACDGRLIASPAGLRYETTHAKDAFTLPFASLEVFEIDYLKKELKIKQRGGKTWNFTDRSDNADRLFVFHRDVTKARDKLKAQ